MSTTNIFCIVGKTEAGKYTYLNKILSNKKFVSKYDLSPLIIGTTRAKKKNEKDGVDFYFHSESEYNKINTDDMIESRSYYTISEGVVYYFTKNGYIENKGNIICTTTPYQYENFKHWCEKENFKCPNKYKLYLIFIDSDIKIRVNRALKKMNTEDEICEFARRILQDKAEFSDAIKRIPELIDPMLSDNVCYIFNNSSDKLDLNNNISKIEKFISDSLK